MSAPPPGPSPAAGPDGADTLLARLAEVQARIAAAVARAGRPEGSVTLVAVSKTYPASDVAVALAAGQAVFGENRVQEAAAKFGPLRAGHAGLRLHLIGALQTNKAREAVAAADVIESLDRPRLADAIAERGPCGCGTRRGARRANRRRPRRPAPYWCK